MDVQGYKFSKTHEWVAEENNSAKIGISDFAQKELGDVVYVELPAVGSVIESSKQFGTVESTKAASEIYAPVNGTVVEVNTELIKNPQLINSDPYGKGWMIRITVTRPEQLKNLLTLEQYQAQAVHH